MNFSCFVYSVLLKCDNQQVCNAIFLFVSHSLLLEILLPKLTCLLANIIIFPFRFTLCIHFIVSFLLPINPLFIELSGGPIVLMRS